MKGLAVEKLKKTFRTTEAYSGTLTVFEELDLEIPGNKVTVIMGPPQCGKSTLMNILAGLTPADDGVFLVDGTPVGIPRGLRAPLLCETPTMFSWLTLRQNIEFAMRETTMNASEKHARAGELIDLIQMTGYQTYYARHLPASLRQIVALARALAVRPHVVLLDNPTARLPGHPRFFFQERLLHIRKKERATMLLATTDIDEAILLGDEIHVLGSRPSVVLKTVPVNLPEARTRRMMGDPAFIEAKLAVMDLLMI